MQQNGLKLDLLDPLAFAFGSYCSRSKLTDAVGQSPPVASSSVFDRSSRRWFRGLLLTPFHSAIGAGLAQHGAVASCPRLCFSPYPPRLAASTPSVFVKWHAGYEQCGRVREAFRMPASLAPLPGRPWPCCRLRKAWLRLLRLLQRVCHRALVLTLGEESAGALPPPATNLRRAMEAEGAEERPANGVRDGFIAADREPSHARHGMTSESVCAVCGRLRKAAGSLGLRRGCCCAVGDNSSGCCSPDTLATGSRPQEGGDAWCDDFSVSYALRYPNEFADPALEKEDLTVGEHVDPSLYVVEPCCGVEGLEIQDRRSGCWVPVEALCANLGGGGGSELDEAEGMELILFGGKALERATDGKVRGAPHRVRRGDDGPRHCFIYEQKYASFFPPPAMD